MVDSITDIRQNKTALTVNEASDYTGIGRNSLRMLIAWQKIPVIWIGYKILIRSEALDRFLKANEGKKLIQEMEDLRYEVKHESKEKDDNITLDTWFDVWLNSHKRRTIKESTRVRYDEFYRRYMQKQIGRQRIVDFNPIILERLLQDMADKDYSTKTIRDVYNILNTLLNMQYITALLLSIHVLE